MTCINGMFGTLGITFGNHYTLVTPGLIDIEYHAFWFLWKRNLELNIRVLKDDDIDDCAKLLIETYNPSPWNNHWTDESAHKYLFEFISIDKFIGFVVEEGDEIVGAMFAHRKTWWTNDEIYIDELFVHPLHQHQGFGRILMNQAEELSKELGLGGVTLLTHNEMPAKLFYEKLGYNLAGHVIFMYKEIQ